MSVDIELKGLQAHINFFRNASSGLIDNALADAVNEALRRGHRLADTEIRSQVNYTQKYLRDAKRLYVRKRASPRDPEGVLAASDRPNSLARFRVGPKRVGNTKRGLRFRVAAKGAGSRIPGTFLINLRGAGGSSEPGVGNQGVAIRLARGERLRGTTGAKRLSNRGRDSEVYLLYGPSPGQVFEDVRNDISGEVGDVLERRFLHNFDRRARRGGR